jgi:hypothetical protein
MIIIKLFSKIFKNNFDLFDRTMKSKKINNLKSTIFRIKLNSYK